MARLSYVNQISDMIISEYQNKWELPKNLEKLGISKDPLEWKIINWCKMGYKYEILWNKRFSVSTCFENDKKEYKVWYIDIDIPEKKSNSKEISLATNWWLNYKKPKETFWERISNKDISSQSPKIHMSTMNFPWLDWISWTTDDCLKQNIVVQDAIWNIEIAACNLGATMPYLKQVSLSWITSPNQIINGVKISDYIWNYYWRDELLTSCPSWWHTITESEWRRIIGVFLMSKLKLNMSYTLMIPFSWRYDWEKIFWAWLFWMLRTQTEYNGYWWKYYTMFFSEKINEISWDWDENQRYPIRCIKD